MSNPKISIITATFNSAKTLEQSLLSVISQNYNNIEYIIIDGGSNDCTLDIIKKYNPEITYCVSEKDKGIYDAWNKGVNKATGDWIAFLGSDDFFYPNAIQEYVDFINKEHINNRECLYISSKIEMITEEGRVLRTYGWPWNWKQFRRINIIAHPGSFQSKYLFKQYGHYDIDYKIVGDYELLLRPKENLKAQFMNKVTVKMTVGGISNQLKMFKELKKAILARGGVSIIRANFDYYIHITKLYFRNLGLKFGLNIYWKRAYK